MVRFGPGDLQLPILMFHHIGKPQFDNRFFTPPDLFDAEMKLLSDWGYTSVSTQSLVDAILHGADLPARPVMITFDDADEDTYTDAFPIMRKYGFTGVMYIVHDYVGTPGKLSIEQIKEMAASGWEVGSHSMTHPMNFKVLGRPDMDYQVITSRKKLEDMLALPVTTFAYPFGDFSNNALAAVRRAGYSAAMGATGWTPNQGLWNLFNLQRCEVKSSDTPESMARFLPWQGVPGSAPQITATP